MCRVPKGLWPTLLLGLAFVQAGCQSDLHPWVPPQDCRVKIISDAEFVRTSRGEYVDGYLAINESEFHRQWIFMVLEIPRYVKDDRLIVTGRFTHDSVRITLGARIDEQVPVFEVGQAVPNIPKAPDIPPLK